MHHQFDAQKRFNGNTYTKRSWTERTLSCCQLSSLCRGVLSTEHNGTRRQAMLQLPQTQHTLLYHTNCKPLARSASPRGCEKLTLTVLACFPQQSEASNFFRNNMIGHKGSVTGLMGKTSSSVGACSVTPNLGPTVRHVHASGHSFAGKSFFMSERTQVSGLRSIREFYAVVRAADASNSQAAAYRWIGCGRLLSFGVCVAYSP